VVVLSSRGVIGLLRDALVYGAGSVLSQVVSFLLLPLYSKELTPADFGVVTVFAVVPVLVMTFATGGIKSAVYYYYHKTEGSERAEMVSVGMWVSIIGALFIATLGFFLRERLTVLVANDAIHVPSFLVALAVAVVGTVSEVPRVVLQSEQRAGVVATGNVLQVLVTLLSTAALVLFLHWKGLGVLVGQLLGALSGAIVTLAATRKSLKASFHVGWWKKMSTYGLPYLPHRIMGVSMGFFAENLIAKRVGLADAGLYGMALRFLIPVVFITGAVQQAWQPYKFKLVSEEKEPAKQFASIITLYLICVTYLWLGTSIWAEHLLVWMVDPTYHPAVTFLGLASLLKVIHGSYPMMSTGLDVGPSAKSIPIGTLVGLTAMVASSFPLLAWEPGRGAVIAAIVGWGACALAFLFLSQRVYPIPFPFFRWILSFIIGAALFVVHHEFRAFSLMQRVFIDVAITFAFPILVAPVLVSSAEQRETARRMGGAILQKVRRKLPGGKR
jgi:O-antigen/teichoic acid export membrane protein